MGCLMMNLNLGRRSYGYNRCDTFGRTFKRKHLSSSQKNFHGSMTPRNSEVPLGGSDNRYLLLHKTDMNKFLNREAASPKFAKTFFLLLYNFIFASAILLRGGEINKKFKNNKHSRSFAQRYCKQIINITLYNVTGDEIFPRRKIPVGAEIHSEISSSIAFYYINNRTDCFENR